MSRYPHQPRDEPPGPPDALLQRYQEANALDEARPSPALRERVLTEARAQAERHAKAPARERPPAANDSAWKLRALGGLAVFGLVGLLALQFDRSPPEERELALGQPSVRAVPVDRPQAAATTSTIAPTSAPGTTTEAPAAPSAQADVMPLGETSATARQPAAAAPPAATRSNPAPASVRVAPPVVAASAADIAAAPVPAPPVPAPPIASAIETQPAPTNARPAAPMASANRNTEAAEYRPESEAKVAELAPETLGRSAPVRSAARREASPSPLTTATARGDADAVRALLAQGMDVNSRDAGGFSALMLAAQRGDLALVRLLLAAGADRQSRDPQGQTAADMARSAGHTAVLELLEPGPSR